MVTALYRDILLVKFPNCLAGRVADGQIELFLKDSDIEADELVLGGDFPARLYRVVDQISYDNAQVNV